MNYAEFVNSMSWILTLLLIISKLLHASLSKLHLAIVHQVNATRKCNYNKLTFFLPSSNTSETGSPDIFCRKKETFVEHYK